MTPNCWSIVAKDYDISLIGPTKPNSSWQSQLENGYDLDQFIIDWENQQVRCPEGNLSTSWRKGVEHTGNSLIQVLFSVKDCEACPAKELCTRAPKRVVGFQPKEQYEALQQARQYHASQEGQQLYNRRAGIEGTLSQGVRAFGLRFRVPTRFVSDKKVRLPSPSLLRTARTSLPVSVCGWPLSPQSPQSHQGASRNPSLKLMAR